MTRRVAAQVVGVVAALIAGLGIGGWATQALAVTAVDEVRGPDPSAQTRPQYKVNSAGESYGSAADASRPQDEPDLIRAVGDNGQLGYVRRTSIAAPTFHSPEAALAWQAGPGSLDRTVPLFAQDGKRVIGTFTMDGVQPGSAFSARASE